MSALSFQASARDLHDPEAGWKALRYFNIYRTILAGLFVVLVLSEVAPRTIGQYDPGLFRGTAIAYLVFGVVSSFTILWRQPPFDAQIVIQIFVDIVAITLLMHASGGVTSGFGMLLIVAIAGGSVLTQGRIAILFAAMASIAVLTQQIYVWIAAPFPEPNYTQAGLLGAAFFATAFLAFFSARRIRASEALAARRAVDLANLARLNEQIIQRMQSGIVATDADGRVLMMNKSAQRLLGLVRRAEGERLQDVAPELWSRMHEWQEDHVRGSHLFQPVRGQVRVVSSFAAMGEDGAEGTLVFVEDASAMTQRAQQLKLASLGRLAASIAHEIRNPLSAVSHAGQLLAESERLDGSDHRLTRIIRDNSERMNAIIESVLQLSRRKPPQPESLHLAPWLRAFADEFAVQGGLAPDAVRLSVEPEDLLVRADPGQLRQVLWNLCENGVRHANGAAALALHAGISPESRRPFLDVSDNGAGIPVDVADQVFEPFFTTRANGTGLGLYIARELCESNQASIDLMPSDGGCRFRITFADPRRQAIPLS